MDKKYISPDCKVYMIELEEMIAASNVIGKGTGNGSHDANAKTFRFDQDFSFDDDEE